MMMPASTYWQGYYSDLAARDQHWLDLSNPRVHAQSVALCIEAAGEVHGHACLDLGCGRGTVASTLQALGAKPVMGVDLVEALLERNRRAFPGITWCQGDASDPAVLDALPDFDRVFLVEVLQYVDMATVVPSVWQKVRPGGRLIGMVPNAACPIVARAAARFGEHYQAVHPDELTALVDGLDDLACWAGRGLSFAHDQQITPYQIGPWTRELAATPPSNRLNLVLIKRV